MKSRILQVTAATLVLVSATLSASAALFNSDIRPILSNNCFQCHGFDKNTREAGLRLDVREDAIAAKAIVPGDPDASAIIQRMESHDPDSLMPPPGSERKVSPEQIALVREWIAQGAEYQPHWSLIAPARPAVPTVTREAWVRNEIDAFVAGRHEREQIEPSPEADRVTLIRRLSIDITGLPPTPSEVRAFLEDDSSNAYEKLVDRLLASPHYGERMAQDWLDLVRYADTNGYHGDQHRDVWPYRDYVIKAFNENKPFDAFTVEQLAGDLLPDATIEQKVASAYNRLNQITAEGGAQAGEYLAKYAADRVRTTSSTWLGATMGCAECHDHKYDPFTARDFYSFAAFFADVQEQGVYSSADGSWAPMLELPTPAQESERAALETEIAALETALNTSGEALLRGQEAWERELRRQLALGQTGWAVQRPEAAESLNGGTLDTLEDASVLSTGEVPPTDTYELTLRPGAGRFTALRLDALLHESLRGLSRNNGNFILTRIEARLDGERIRFSGAQATYEQEDWPVAHAIDRKKETGWAVSGHIEAREQSALFPFREPIECTEGSVLTVSLEFEQPNHLHHAIGRFRLALSTDETPEFSPAEGLPSEVYQALRVYTPLRTPEEREALAKHYRAIAPELDDERAKLAELREARSALQTQIARTLVTVSVEPRVMRVLPRGNWMDESGDIVEPAVPASLPPLDPAASRATRLDLARWLVAPENPLTARVQVNRLWDRFFGTGISKVLDDLGSQGEWPTHPALLDWLAVEFRESGWDFKHMIQLLVTSSAYRQESLPRDDLEERDPFNRLLARQSRFRLPAELVRDNALRVSGLLVPAVGGRSVFPYQPEGYWDNCNTFTGPLIYNTDAGDNQYRRGLYTYWKRSFLHPSMVAFDAPNREECVAERVVSNTPLQALVLLNDPTYVEAARVFAGRIWNEGGTGVSDRITWAYLQALSREPSDEELLLLARLYLKHRGEYLADTASAEAVFAIGFSEKPAEVAASELAAWTSIARVILNLHETVTRS